MHKSSSSSSSDTSEPLARSDSASTINISNKSSRSRGVSSKGFSITLTRPPPPTSSSSNKRRRQNKEEQAFNAANIQQSLADAGRPPMSIQGRRERALPKYLGAVDMDTAKLITSTQFDNENEDTPSSSSSVNDDKYDVQSMNMYANLIQSTRHYYTVSNDEEDITTTTTTTVRPHHHPAKTQSSSRKQSSTSYNNENDEDNSGMSTWTPPTPGASSLNDSLNDYLRQNIDNDNRSDNMSSDMADSTSSDSLSSCSDDGSTDDPQQDEQEEDEKDRFAEHITIVG